MTNNIRLIVIKNGSAFDMSDLVTKITWSGRKGAAARTLSVDIIDDDGYRHDRAGIDVWQGHQCIFFWKERELFRGLFMRQEQSQRKALSLIAYDRGIYLANNKDTFNYTNATASEIFADCCARFGIPVDGIADTRYRIPELVKPKTTAWDVIADALSLTMKATGVRFYPMCAGECLRLVERRGNILQWVIETGVNVEGYSQIRSIENIKTRMKLLSSEDTVLAEASEFALEARIGVFQDIINMTDEMNEGQLTDIVYTALAENHQAMQTLSVSALGQPDVITGVGVFVDIKPLALCRTFYVEEDTHTFDGHDHRMRLNLALATDVAQPGYWTQEELDPNRVNG